MDSLKQYIKKMILIKKVNIKLMFTNALYI